MIPVEIAIQTQAGALAGEMSRRTEMLAKCANGSCFALFRHLAEGRLFRLESGSPPGSSTFNRVEHFWLCPRCSATMTLHLKEDGSIGTVVSV